MMIQVTQTWGSNAIVLPSHPRSLGRDAFAIAVDTQESSAGVQE